MAANRQNQRHSVQKASILRKDNVVGFEDEVRTLIGHLTEETEQLDVISIIGTAGHGKSTVAWKIFHDPRIMNEFPKRIWVHVSQEFSERDIFLRILKELDIDHNSDGELAELVSFHLKNDKFLLVMDGVWTPEDWDKLQLALPTNNKRGKVLITSRQVEVGRYANRNKDPHMLRFLTLPESWLLLRLEVFRRPSFPSELEAEGKLIAQRCGGLPLAIVVIARILVKKFSASGDVSSLKKSWKKVCESFYTYLNDDPEKRIAKSISLSYQILPYHLRDCFLYMGMFPEDSEIPVGKLMPKWIVEGIIQLQDDISQEETAESNLQDLINLNLVRADKLKCDGKIKTCRIHGVVRDFCRTEAGFDRENFFQEIKKSSDGGFQPGISKAHKHRRLCIQPNVFDFLSEKPSCPSVRSLVCFSKDESPMHEEHNSAMFTAFNQLKVLDIKPIIFSKIPSDMYVLVQLQYISLSINSAVIPQAFSKFRNIQTLIVNTISSTLEVRADILNMVELRVFKTNTSAGLPETGKSHKGGKKIHTLGMVSPESCRADVFDRACNLKELSIKGRLAFLLENKKGSFDSLGKLSKLVKLKLWNDSALYSHSELHLLSLPPASKFPTGLTHITLCNTYFAWPQMSILGSLDNLEVLKLKHKAFWGETWVVTDGGFRCLRVLHIGDTNLENWVASRNHFPLLECLELRNCENLKQIPTGLAQIPNFQNLDLHRSKQAAASAESIRGIKRRLEDQQSLNARRFKLSIFPPPTEND